MNREDRPLANLVVVDLTTRLGAYAGKLLSDLGANVYREIYEVDLADPHTAFWYGARDSTLTFDSREERDKLLAHNAVVLTDQKPEKLLQMGFHPEATVARLPSLIHVAITPYGLDGPKANWEATDLTLLADGGLLVLCGDPDRPPVRPGGEQSVVAVGVHAACATLLAVLARDRDGEGQIVDVSAQEAVVHSTENAVQYFDLEGIVRSRQGAGPREAGVGIFSCRDGYVYLLAAMGGITLTWQEMVEWMEESFPESKELRRSRWKNANYRRSDEAIEIFRRLFEGFCSGFTCGELYEAAQARGISLAPVAMPADVLANTHLRARHFFRPKKFGDVTVEIPGPPYRFTPQDSAPEGFRSSFRGIE